MALLFTSTLTVLLQRILLSFLCCCSLFFSELNATKFSISFGRVKRQPQAWWSPEVVEAVSERRKAFASAHKSDKNDQVYISASLHASFSIAKPKTEA